MPWRTLLPRRHPPTLRCRELVDLIGDYLDDALPPARRAAIDGHLEGCAACRAYLDQLRQTTGLVERLCDEPLPAELESQLLEAFRHWNDVGPASSA